VLPKLKQKTKAVVYWGAGEPTDGDRKALKSAKIPLHSFLEFEKLGRDKPKDPVPPGPQDPCTIMYTRCGAPCLPSHSRSQRISRGMKSLAPTAEPRPHRGVWRLKSRR
jgi:hypothetical protein